MRHELFKSLVTAGLAESGLPAIHFSLNVRDMLWTNRLKQLDRTGALQENVFKNK
jgi:hypothetical protein